MAIPAGTLEIEILTNMAQLQEEMRQIQKAVGDMGTGVAKSARAANDNIGSIGKTSGLAKHHVQNLAFQFQDLGLQLTAAAQSSKPMQMAMMALFQQGTQISGVMSQAGIGVGGLAKEMGAMAVRAAPLIIAVGAIATGVGLLTSEINENSKVHVTWQDTLLGAYDATKKYLTDELTGAFKAFGLDASDVWGDVVNATKWAFNWIIGIASAGPRTLILSFKVLPAALADIFYSTVNGVIGAMNSLVQSAVDTVNGFVNAVNPILAKVGLEMPGLVAPKIGLVRNAYAGAADVAAKAYIKNFTDTFTRDFTGEAADAISPFAQARALARPKKDAKKAGKQIGSALREGAEDEIKQLLAFLEGVMGELAQYAAWNRKALADDWPTMMDALAAKQAKATQGVIDAADANASWNNELRETINMLDQLGGFGGKLGNLGAMFEALGSGNWSSVRGPLGVIGGALGSVGWTSMDANGDRTIHLLGDEFKKVLNSVFGTDGNFTKTLKSAGLGMAAGQIALGSKNSGLGSAVGGVLGEVAGKALGKGMGKMLGSAMGPIGSILGGVLGGALGSALKKVKNGYGIATNTGVTSGGTSADLAASSKTSASGIVGAIENIAEQLGGSVGQYAVSIGKRSSGWIRVSASGSSRVGDKHYNSGPDVIYNGKDEAEAMRIALLNAIRDGAIQGVRLGTQALLKKDGDIESQLAKALKFEGVFKSLKQAMDPVGFALEQLTREFDGLRKIFNEAGASAADYADLEKLLNIQKQEALDKAAAEVRQKALEAVNDPLKLQIRILELMGKEQDAVAAARLMELAGLKGSLQPLQAMVYQLEDARAIIEQFGPLADDLRAYKKEILGGQTGNTFAQLVGQFRQTAGMAANGDATAIGQLRTVSGQYLDAAKENAATALDYQRAVSEVLAAVDRGIFAADSQVDYAQAQIDAIEHTGQILQSMRSELASLQRQVLDESQITRKLWQRFEGNGMPVNGDAGPLPVSVVP